VEASDTSYVVWRGLMSVFQADPTSVDVEIKMVNPRGRWAREQAPSAGSL